MCAFPFSSLAVVFVSFQYSQMCVIKEPTLYLFCTYHYLYDFSGKVLSTYNLNVDYTYYLLTTTFDHTVMDW